MATSTDLLEKFIDELLQMSQQQEQPSSPHPGMPGQRGQTVLQNIPFALDMPEKEEETASQQKIDPLLAAIEKLTEVMEKAATAQTEHQKVLQNTAKSTEAKGRGLDKFTDWWENASESAKQAVDLKGSKLGQLHRAGQTLGKVAGYAKEAGFDETGAQLEEAADVAQLGARAAAGDPSAIAGLVKKAIKKIKEKIALAIGSVTDVGEAFKSERAGDVGAKMGSSLEKLGKLSGIPHADLPGKFAKGLFESLEGLRDWNESLHKANMQFAEFSAGMAVVQAQQEMRDIQLSRERGDRRAESAGYLAHGKFRLEESLAPMEDALANFKNWFTGWFNENLASIFDALNQYLGLFVKGGGEPKDEVGMGEWLTGIEKQWMEKYGRPRR